MYDTSGRNSIRNKRPSRAGWAPPTVPTHDVVKKAGITHPTPLFITGVITASLPTSAPKNRDIFCPVLRLSLMNYAPRIAPDDSLRTAGPRTLPFKEIP